MDITVTYKDSLYQGCESKYLIKRLVYLVDYAAQHKDAKSEREEIEQIKNLLEQQDIIVYLQRREKELSKQMSESVVGSAGYAETTIRHTEVLDIMKDNKIGIV